MMLYQVLILIIEKKFADLLFEKFADYQIILLTHEEQWFQYISQVAKGKGWIINEIKWSESRGTYLEESSFDLKTKIEEKHKNEDIEFISN